MPMAAGCCRAWVSPISWTIELDAHASLDLLFICSPFFLFRKLIWHFQNLTLVDDFIYLLKKAIQGIQGKQLLLPREMLEGRIYTMKLNLILILTVSLAATFGFFIGVSFPVQIAPQLRCYVLPYWSGDGGAHDANSTTFSAINVLGSNKTAGEGGTATAPVLQPNATSEVTAGGAPPAGPKGAERLPPKVVVSESDLHMRRLWGNPWDDSPVRKYLLTMTVGYTEKDNVNATVHKFSDNFDVMLFHYDGKTTEWDADFAWSKNATHVSARKQAKWWFAKRFLHPSIVAAYDYVFLWDEDLDTKFFDAEEYLRIVKKHGLEISQPGLDPTRGKTSYELLIRRSNNSGEVHKNTIGGPGNCPDVHQRPCSGFVEVMAPVFTREAWACVWHMVQNDLVHGWGLDLNFWRCVEDPEERIGVVDAQYVAHRARPTLNRQGDPEKDGGGGDVRGRAWHEWGDFKSRIINADRAQQAALLAPPRPK